MRLFLLFTILFPFISFAQDNCVHTFSGTITSGKEPLPGAVIRLTGTTRGAVTDGAGKFSLGSVCPATYEVEVSFLGYNTIRITIEINGNVQRNIVLEEEAKKLNEVVITGQTDNIDHAQNYVTLTEKDLAATAGKTLGESLKEISGVNTIQAGPGVFKPVIHGVHSTRILILNHGIRQEGQQWGAEHAPEIDPFVASELVVIKDASAIKYGTDALGGVIVVNPAPLPEKSGLGGSLNAIGQTNGRGGTMSAMIEGGIKDLPGWGWRMQGTAKRVGDYHTPKYQLTNTGSKELDFSGATGYHGKTFGAEVFFSHFQTELGILKGTAISSTSDLANAMNAEQPQYTQPFSYHIGEPRQEVSHNLLKLNAHKDTKHGALHFQYGYQQNARKEFNIRRGAYSERPVIDLKLMTHSMEAEWEMIKKHLRSFCIGVNGMIQQNDNVFGTMRIPFIPNYSSVSTGPFAVSKFYLKAWTLDVGARYDYRYYDVSGFDSKNTSFKTNIHFQNVSTTAGATVQLKENQSLMFNFSTAWRPPHVAELYSAGTHQSAVSNEYGFLLDDQTSEVKDIRSVDFQIEKAFKWVTTYKYNTQSFQVEGTAYVNFIKNYIYLKPVGLTQTLTAALPALKYTQTDALFIGMDLAAEWQMTKRVTLAPKVTLLRASDYRNNDYLVYIPANRAELNVRYDIPKWKGLTGIFIESRGRYTFKQYRAPRVIRPETLNEAMNNGEDPLRDDSSNFDFMAPPDGYFLWSVSTGIMVPAKRGRYEFRISAENILNTSYREYTNRFKYFADEIGRNVTLGAKYVF